MTNKLFNVSQSPHLKINASISKIMIDVIIALVPALIVSIYIFGVGALRVTLVAITSAVIFEYLIQRYLLKVQTTINDFSAVVTGMLLAFNLPSNIPSWMIVIGSLVAIGIAKMSFGGLGNNPFNPALVGRVFLLISFPVEMTIWPKPVITRMNLTDAVTGATPLAIVKEGIQNGVAYIDITKQIPSYWDMFLGTIGGCIGEVSAAALILGFIYLIHRKVITWHIPVSMIGTIALLTGILCFLNPTKYPDPMFHLLTGGIMLGAIFMATDMVTSPMTYKGMVIFGIGIGLITVLIRVYGAYPEGVSFAILIMNAFVPLINRYCKPIRYGESNG